MRAVRERLGCHQRREQTLDVETTHLAAGVFPVDEARQLTVAAALHPNSEVRARSGRPVRIRVCDTRSGNRRASSPSVGSDLGPDALSGRGGRDDGTGGRLGRRHRRRGLQDLRSGDRTEAEHLGDLIARRPDPSPGLLNAALVRLRVHEAARSAG
jgi:hypothetical protein